MSDASLSRAVAEWVVAQRTEQRLPTRGTVISQLPHLPASSPEPPAPLASWQYGDEGLVKVEGGAIVAAAIGTDRSLWPTAAYLFELREREGSKGRVIMDVLYSAGLTATSRGGYRCELTVTRLGDTWRVVSQRILQMWD